MIRQLALPLIACALSAATVPQPGMADPHIQTVFYQPDDVVQLRGAMGWQIMIEFAPDERIENVSIGDSLAWQVTPNKRARDLFLKPLSRRASTNMTVVTNQRRYAFSLTVGPRAATTPWVLRFDYPPPPLVVEADPPPPPPPLPLNYRYGLGGDASVLPVRVWDDGRQTYFEFAEQTAIPAIFAAGPGKKEESLVNVATRGRLQVVQQLGVRFILRSGERVGIVAKVP